MNVDSEQDMLKFGEQFANYLTGRVTALGGPPSSLTRMGEKSRQDPPHIIELIGDVGAGKTTFVRGLAKGLGIKEPVTSPSFTISKTYALPNNKNLIHYDFYRLSDPGLMIEDLEENLNNKNNIIVIEWGESVKDLLPKNHIVIKIEYTETGRKITL